MWQVMQDVNVRCLVYCCTLLLFQGKANRRLAVRSGPERDVCVLSCKARAQGKQGCLLAALFPESNIS